MKNFKAAGETLTFTNGTGADIASGSLVMLGALFGVASSDIGTDAEGVLNLGGVYDLAKAPSQAWTVGAAVYWDAANARATTAASGNTKIGVAVAAVGGSAGETIGTVRLNGAF